MAVIGHGQGIMSQRLRSIARLFERAEHHAADAVVLRRIRTVGQHPLKHARMRVLAQMRALTVQVQKRLQRLHALRIRRFVHAVHKGQAGVARQPRHAFVGCQHEALDHALGLAARTAEYLGGFAALVQHKFGLGHVQIEATPRAAPRSQHAVEHPHLFKRLPDVGGDALAGAFKQAVHAVIGQPRAGADQRAAQMVVGHAAVG